MTTITSPIATEAGTAPPRPPARASWGERFGPPSSTRDLAAALAGGVAFDVFIRTGVASVGGAAAVIVAVGALLATGRITNRASQVALLATPVFAVWLLVRMSPWVLLPNLAASAALVGAAALWAGGGSLADISPRRAVLAGVHALRGSFEGPGFLLGAVARLTSRASARNLAVLRGVLISLPLLLVLGALLVSADALFASFLSVDADAPTVFEHTFLIVLGATGLAALAATATHRPPDNDLLPGTPRLGSIEITVVLGGLTTLFAAFVGTQVASFLGGARLVERSAGLTYAEHARSGFFQLLAVATLTLLVLGAVRVLINPDDVAASRRLTLLSELAIVLTLAIVGVAIRRLSLYEAAYGMTVLRLYSTIAAVWIGAVFVLLGLRVAGVGRGRHWLLPAVAALALLFTLALNFLNPEASVVRHNLARGDGATGLDVGYLGRLSADAVPALAGAIDDLSAEDAAIARRELCSNPPPPPGGWAATNLSANKAHAIRSRLCPTPLHR